VTDEDIQARFAEIERRLAALESAQREHSAEAAPSVWVRPEWLAPLDELFKTGNPARALSEADKLRAQANAASSTTQLEELQAYLSRVPVRYPKLNSVMLAIDQNLATLRGIPRGPERRTDLRPFPASHAAPPAERSVPAAGDDVGDAGEN
jgi:hypothetical protein